MSSVPTIDITASLLYQLFGNWLQAQLGAGTTVEQGQLNRISMPQGNFIVMTLIGSEEDLHKGTRNYTWIAADPNPGVEKDTKGVKAVLQIDFYGSNSHDWASLIGRLVSTQYNIDYFAQQNSNGGPDVQPLFATGAKNLALINGEGQYEPRWSLDLHFQYNPTISFPQDFMDALDIHAVSVESQFPPE